MSIPTLEFLQILRGDVKLPILPPLKHYDATGMGVMPEPLNSLSNALEQKT